MLLVNRNTFDMLSFISLMSLDKMNNLASSAMRLRLVRGMNSSSESEDGMLITLADGCFLDSFRSDSFTAYNFLLPTFQNLRLKYNYYVTINLKHTFTILYIESVFTMSSRAVVNFQAVRSYQTILSPPHLRWTADVT